MKPVDTALGPIEAETRGTGVPVLVLHGTPGGIDAARAMSRFLPEDTFETICISRPGYLATPLDPADASIDHEADLLAALLDTLGVACAGVLAWSGGGPVAYRLAARHPDRVSAMVAVAALSARWVAPRPTLPEWITLATPLGRGLIACLSRWAPERIIHGALEGTGALGKDAIRARVRQVMSDPRQRQLILDLVATVSIAGRRRAGWRNDLANFARLDSLELARVRCPVLLVQGDGDVNVAPEYSHSAHAALPASTLLTLQAGTHLAFYAHPEASRVQERAQQWFINHA